MSASRRCWRSGCRARACRGGPRSARCLLMGALVGLVERPPGHAGQDRFLHRDARHRHHALRPQRLVHGRPAGARRPAAASSSPFPAASGSCRRRRSTRSSSALTLWIVFEYLPLGRYLYVLGASPRAAELNGISARRYITLGFVAAGTLAAFAGVVLQSQLQVGQSSVGQEYLLAGLHRGAARRDLDPAGPGQRLGDGARRRRCSR